MSADAQCPVGQVYELIPNNLIDFASSLDGLRNLIEGLRGGMKFHYGFDEIRIHVDAMVRACCGNCYGSYAIPAPFAFVRARRHDDPGQLYREACDLGAPRREDIKKFGRCNVPNQPVLYCSLYPETALSELDAQREEVFTLASYAVQPEKKIYACHVGEIDYYRRTYETYFGRRNEGNTRRLQALETAAQWDSQCLLDAFLAEEFISPAKSQADYRVTSAFCDLLWKANGSDLDAIMYPSVAFREGKNFALHVKAAENKLELLSMESRHENGEVTRVVRVDDVLGYGIYRVTEIARLHSIYEGNLKWVPTNIRCC